MADYALMGPKWGPSSQYGTTGGTITWSFATGNYYGQPYQWDYRISDSAQQDAIRRAFAAWEAVCNIDFVEVADSSTVDVRLGWDYIDGGDGTLGECLTSWTGNTITDADIRFDTSENWSVGGKSLYLVAVHEIGHALGLEHFDGAPVIMNTYYGVSALQPGDIEGIRTLYGYTRTSYVGTAANEKFDLHTLTYVLTISGGTGDDFLWSGPANDRLFGEAGRDIIVGNPGSDEIYGENDATSTSGSNDQLLGGYGNDVIYGGGGNDYIHGEWDNDTLNGGAGSDLIYGGFGADTLNGGDGNDVLWGATAGTLQGSWFGTAIHLARNGVTGAAISENWTIAGEAQANDASNDKLAGGAGSDVLYGNAGNDWLNGGTGVDQMSGGIGDDRYYVDSASDKVFEASGQGNDAVYASVNYTLATGQHVETLATTFVAGTGTINLAGNERSQRVIGNNGNNGLYGNGGNDQLYGNGGNDVLAGGTGNDTLTGGAGNDWLDGSEGSDTMHGGAGNDTYVVDHTNDIVNEGLSGSGGTDAVRSKISFNLTNAARAIGAVENLYLQGTAAINGIGNGLANVINGNIAANVLIGSSGNDILNGGGGNDTLYGGAGNDRLTGGVGNDFFVFNSYIGGIDTITDFSVVQDTIRLDNAVMPGLGATLGTLSAAKFWRSTTGSAHDANDRIIYETDTGKLIYDSNGNASGGAVHFATLAPNLALTNADFQVI